MSNRNVEFSKSINEVVVNIVDTSYNNRNEKTRYWDGGGELNHQLDDGKQFIRKLFNMKDDPNSKFSFVQGFNCNHLAEYIASPDTQSIEIFIHYKKDYSFECGKVEVRTLGKCFEASDYKFFEEGLPIKYTISFLEDNIVHIEILGTEPITASLNKYGKLELKNSSLDDDKEIVKLTCNSAYEIVKSKKEYKETMKNIQSKFKEDLKNKLK